MKNWFAFYWTSQWGRDMKQRFGTEVLKVITDYSVALYGTLFGFYVKLVKNTILWKIVYICYKWVMLEKKNYKLHNIYIIMGTCRYSYRNIVSCLRELQMLEAHVYINIFLYLLLQNITIWVSSLEPSLSLLKS